MKIVRCLAEEEKNSFEEESLHSTFPIIYFKGGCVGANRKFEQLEVVWVEIAAAATCSFVTTIFSSPSYKQTIL